ncbi:SapB/AmfS family lanthipeptide [Embleya scabrispora]|nr:SapB/AmfS family lanthipeptide [Embleya scabrispora]MYS85558.1 SapB/AmfS family lantipeptide [Streptomyces sp. SID5474]
MALLDLQALETDEAPEFGGGGGGSRASLLLCGNSSLSLVTCN